MVVCPDLTVTFASVAYEAKIYESGLTVTCSTGYVYNPEAKLTNSTAVFSRNHTAECESDAVWRPAEPQCASKFTSFYEAISPVIHLVNCNK